jgi:hypothetical protein
MSYWANGKRYRSERVECDGEMKVSYRDVSQSVCIDVSMWVIKYFI